MKCVEGLNKKRKNIFPFLLFKSGLNLKYGHSKSANNMNSNNNNDNNIKQEEMKQPPIQKSTKNTILNRSMYSLFLHLNLVQCDLNVHKIYAVYTLSLPQL